MPAGGVIHTGAAVCDLLGHGLVVAHGHIGHGQTLRIDLLHFQQALAGGVADISVFIGAVFLGLPAAGDGAVGGQDRVVVVAGVAGHGDADGILAAQLGVLESLRHGDHLVEGLGGFHVHLIQPVLTDPQDLRIVVEVVHAGRGQDLTIHGAGVPHVQTVHGFLHQALLLVALIGGAHILQYAVFHQRVKHGFVAEDDVGQVAGGHGGIDERGQRDFVFSDLAFHINIQIILVRVDPHVLGGGGAAGVVRVIVGVAGLEVQAQNAELDGFFVLAVHVRFFRRSERTEAEAQDESQCNSDETFHGIPSLKF